MVLGVKSLSSILSCFHQNPFINLILWKGIIHHFGTTNQQDDRGDIHRSAPKHSGLCGEIQEHPNSGTFFCKTVAKDQRTALLEEFTDLEVDKGKKTSWISAGELINFGKSNYDFDDRSYLP
jgi:hypothetical protein